MNIYTFLDECVLKLLTFITVTNFRYTVFGPDHVFKLPCTVLGGTIRFDDTFLFIGQGAELPIKDL